MGASVISGFVIEGKTGTLTELSGSPFLFNAGLCAMGSGSPRAITTEPTGRFVFVGGLYFPEGDNIDAGNGTLSRASATGGGLSRLRSDPSGKFFYGIQSPQLAGYEVDDPGSFFAL